MLQKRERKSGKEAHQFYPSWCKNSGEFNSQVLHTHISFFFTVYRTPKQIFSGRDMNNFRTDLLSCTTHIYQLEIAFASQELKKNQFIGFFFSSFSNHNQYSVFLKWYLNLDQTLYLLTSKEFNKDYKKEGHCTIFSFNIGLSLQERLQW